MVPEGGEAGRRDEGTQAGDEVQRREQDRLRPVSQGFLELVPNAVAVPRDALLADRRPGHVSAHPLQAPAIPAVNGRSHMHIHASHFGGRERGARPGVAHGSEELGGALTGFGAQELDVGGRRTVAGRQYRLIRGEGLGASVPLEYSEQPCVSPRRRLRNVLRGRLAQGVEPERAVACTDPRAAGGQGVEMRP